MPPQIAALRELPEAEHRLHQVVFDRFIANSEWSLAGGLQHALDIAGEELDDPTVGARINRVLGHVDSISYQRPRRAHDPRHRALAVDSSGIAQRRQATS
jgi:hypothetical protein